MAKEGIPTAPDVGKILIAFAFIAGIALGTAFAYYIVLPISSQSVQSQSASLRDQVDLLSQQVDDLTLQLEKIKNPEKFQSCDQNVAFAGSCEKLCTGVQFNPVSKSCEERTSACCTVTSPFDSVDTCNTACALVQSPVNSPQKTPIVFLQTDKLQYARGEQVSVGVFNASETTIVLPLPTGLLSVEKKNGDQWISFGSLIEKDCSSFGDDVGDFVSLPPSKFGFFSWKSRHIDCTNFAANGVQTTIQATNGSYRFSVFVTSAQQHYTFYSNEFTVQ